MNATTATRITLDDTIVTRHGSNFGTVEIDSIERAGTTPAGVALIKVTGYRMIRGGICGPFENTYRADDTVEVAAGRRPTHDDARPLLDAHPQAEPGRSA